MAFAGSAVSMPKFIVGTNCWFCSQTSVRVHEPPAWMLCEPRSQLSVFSMTFVDASRAEYAPVEAAFVIPPTVLMLSRKPAWSATGMPLNWGGDLRREHGRSARSADGELVDEVPPSVDRSVPRVM